MAKLQLTRPEVIYLKEALEKAINSEIGNQLEATRSIAQVAQNLKINVWNDILFNLNALLIK